MAHLRVGGLLGLICLCTVQVTPAFAMNPTRATGNDAFGEPRVVMVTVPSGRLRLGSIANVKVPEPGILAALGCGLLLLGIACRSSSGKSRLSRPAVVRSAPERLGSSNNVDEVAHVG
jgi:hypothetical protein